MGAARAEPELRFDAAEGTVSLSGLAEAPPEGTEGSALLLRVVPEETGAKLPAVAGTYAFADGTLVFRPRFGFDRGVPYRAEASGGKVTLDFSLPRGERAPSTLVEAVYPEAATLPENHLRFYLHFSAPMSRGFAAKHVRLLDAEGKALDGSFLDLAEELWDRKGTRLTLLFDPGRVKTGLVPHEEDGPVLERGKSYTLEIDTGFEDAEGTPLREGFRRGFAVGAPDTEQPSLGDWGVAPPPRGTRNALVVIFGQVLDHAMILRMIEVVDADGKPVPGALAALEGDTACAFTPDAPWPPGPYKLRVNRLLEDPSGNSIARPFELKDETFAPRSLRTHAERAFEIPE